mgnify:CR=1 FL=1
MKHVELGGQGLKVSRISLGCMGMSEFYATCSEEEGIATIHSAIEQGVNFLDTSDMYGPFTNEILIGKAIADRREKVILATKFGNERTPEGQYLGVNGRPEYIRKCCDASLKRLKVSVIDLYYQHRVDPKVPIEETFGAMAELVKEGKVRYLGISEAKPETIRRAHKVHPLTALQTEYSIWSREPEDELLKTVRELRIGFVAYSPLGRGFLTGRYKQPEDFGVGDFRRYFPRFQDGNFYKNFAVVEQLESLAREKKISTAQLALAWVLAQGEDIVALPGTKNLNHLKEDIDSVNIHLSQAELDNINRFAPKDFAAGDRYADMSSINL